MPWINAYLETQSAYAHPLIWHIIRTSILGKPINYQLKQETKIENYKFSADNPTQEVCNAEHNPEF